MQGVVSEAAPRLDLSHRTEARPLVRSRSSGSRLVVTLVPRAVRDRVDVAGLGLYSAVHTESMREARVASET